MILGGGPINRPIPSKYRPHGRPAHKGRPVKFPAVGKLPKPKGTRAVPVANHRGMTIQQALQAAKSRNSAAPRSAVAKAPVYANPLRGIAGLIPGRIDQGVDYAAPGGSAIHAIGPGKIISAQASGSGWPGGGFIAEQLTSGPAKGHVWYTAEDVAPSVRPGQVVSPKTVIGKFTGSTGYIETGWGTEGGNVGNAIASGPAYGQPAEAAQGSDPGAVATGWGQAASKLLHSLGAPAGILNQPRSGGAPGWASAPGGKYIPGKTTAAPPPPAFPVSFRTPIPSSGSAGGTAAHAPAAKAARTVRNVLTGGPAKIPGGSDSTSPTPGGRASTGSAASPPPATGGITGTPRTTGNVLIATTGPFPSPYTTLWGTTGTSSSTSAVLLLGGAALLVLFLVMDARKGRRQAGK